MAPRRLLIPNTSPKPRRTRDRIETGLFAHRAYCTADNFLRTLYTNIARDGGTRETTNNDDRIVYRCLPTPSVRPSPNDETMVEGVFGLPNVALRKQVPLLSFYSFFTRNRGTRNIEDNDDRMVYRCSSPAQSCLGVYQYRVFQINILTQFRDMFIGLFGNSLSTTFEVSPLLPRCAMQ